jgi:heme-degrading monooxygenase HmoA
MVLEVAQFDITAGQEEEFASAFKTARQLLADTPGFRSVRMTRGIETPTRFVLLVEWDSVEAHMVTFRESERFPEWRRLIGPYFASAPLVEHYADI